MTYYIDTPVLVGAVTDEPHRLVIRAWLKARETELAISSWVLTEVASALSIKVRRREMTELDKAAAIGQVEEMRSSFLEMASIKETHFFAARRFADFHQTGLRGGDALHAAIAANHGFTLVTMDRTFANGCRLLDLAVVELQSSFQ